MIILLFPKNGDLVAASPEFEISLEINATYKVYGTVLLEILKQAIIYVSTFNYRKINQKLITSHVHNTLPFFVVSEVSP